MHLLYFYCCIYVKLYILKVSWPKPIPFPLQEWPEAMSITPPLTPPAGDEGSANGLEGDSEDFIDFILGDPCLIFDQGKGSTLSQDPPYLCIMT